MFSYFADYFHLDGHGKIMASVCLLSHVTAVSTNSSTFYRKSQVAFVENSHLLDGYCLRFRLVLKEHGDVVNRNG